jgi:hypothetical protein
MSVTVYDINIRLIKVVYGKEGMAVDWKCLYSAWFQTSVANWMRTAMFCIIKQVVLVLSYRRFGTSNWSHLYGPRSPLDAFFLRVKRGTRQDTLPFNLGLICCPETSVSNYHYSLRNNSVEFISYSHNHLILQTAVHLDHYNKVTHLEYIAIFTAPFHCNNTDKP